MDNKYQVAVYDRSANKKASNYSPSPDRKSSPDKIASDASD